MSNIVQDGHLLQICSDISYVILMYNFHICITLLHCLNYVFCIGYSVILFIPVVVVLANTEDTMSLMIEAQKQGLMNGEYVFLLVQQFEVSGKVVSKR